MTSRRRWFIVACGLLLAVWMTIVAYRTNPVVGMPRIFPQLTVTPCANLIPGDLQVERWIPRECYVRAS